VKSLKSTIKDSEKKVSKDASKEVEQISKQRNEALDQVEQLRVELEAEKSSSKLQIEALTDTKKAAQDRVESAEAEIAELKRQLKSNGGAVATPPAGSSSAGGSSGPVRSTSYGAVLAASVSRRDPPKERPEIPVHRLNSAELLDLINSLDDFEDAEHKNAGDKPAAPAPAKTNDGGVDLDALLADVEGNHPPKEEKAPEPSSDKLEKKKSSNRGKHGSRATMAVTGDSRSDLEKLIREEDAKNGRGKKSAKTDEDAGVSRTKSSSSKRSHSTKKKD
jgi:hypothetical protein